MYTVCERPDFARVEGEELPFAFQALRHTGYDIRIDDEEIRPSFDRERELMVTSDIEVHVFRYQIGSFTDKLHEGISFLHGFRIHHARQLFFVFYKPVPEFFHSSG